RRAIGFDLHRIEQVDGRAPAAQPGQFLARVLDRVVHALLDFDVQTFQIIDIHTSSAWCRRLDRNGRPDGFTHDDAAQVARLEQIEYDDWQLVVHAERDGSRVHHTKIPLEHLEVRDRRVTLGGLVD